jgi:hypothetical protein
MTKKAPYSNILYGQFCFPKALKLPYVTNRTTEESHEKGCYPGAQTPYPVNTQNDNGLLLKFVLFLY